VPVAVGWDEQHSPLVHSAICCSQALEGLVITQAFSIHRTYKAPSCCNAAEDVIV